MTAQGHTPGPWYYDGDLHIRRVDTDGFVAEVCEDDAHIELAHRESMPFQANAAHIVHCVNAHDDTIHHLRNIAELQPDPEAGKQDLWLAIGEMRNIARAALAALESGANGEG